MKTKEMMDGTHKRNQVDDWEAEMLDVLDGTIEEAVPIPRELFEHCNEIRKLAEANKKREVALARPVDITLEEAFNIAFERYEKTLEELAKK